MCPSNDIRLHGLTFFGPQYAVPFSGGSVSYFAQIRMDKEVPRARTWSDYLWGIWTGTVPHTSILDGFYMSESVWKVTVKEEDAKNPITIMLGKRVELPAGEWIHIRFQLDVIQIFIIFLFNQRTYNNYYYISILHKIIMQGIDL